MIGVTLRLAARQGRSVLVAGLVAGLALPTLALSIREALPALIFCLLALTAARIGWREATGSLGDIRRTFATLLVYQVGMPLAALALFSLMGVREAPFALALVLLLAAPSVTGAPNFAVLMGKDPAPAMRLLVLGTALFPLTVLTVLWSLPGLDDWSRVISAGLRLALLVAGAAALGFALREGLARDLSSVGRTALDGMAAILLAVVVIGLMSAIRPALAAEPFRLALWLGTAFAANFGLQIAAIFALGRSGQTPARAIVAGNRNIALMLLALPDAITDPILVFIGCYQIPMYLTPILMARIYPHS